MKKILCTIAINALKKKKEEKRKKKRKKEKKKKKRKIKSWDTFFLASSPLSCQCQRTRNSVLFLQQLLLNEVPMFL